MAEKRSIPAALGIVIGPAVTYISFLIFKSELSEVVQCICFALLFLAAFDLSRSSLSPTGVLTILLVPSIPIAMYLSQSALADANQLSPKLIISFWVASVLLGSLTAGMKARQPSGDTSASVKRLVLLTSLLLLGLIGYYFVQT